MDVDVVIMDAERVMNKALDADGVEPTIYYVGQSLAMLNAAILREINGLRRDIERLRAIA
jgi:hypothetical protein